LLSAQEESECLILSIKWIPFDNTVWKNEDGTVRYWSLQHVRTWENEYQVSIDELDGADHREILADKRFHEVLIDYVRMHTKQVVAEDAVLETLVSLRVT